MKYAWLAKPADVIGGTRRERAAWKIRPIDPPKRPDHKATVSAWLVKFPGANAMWEHWIVSAIHLRDIPGVPPANIRLPGASHEFLIATINPDHLEQADPDNWGEVGYLMPIDLAYQVAGISDEDAGLILGSVVRAMVEGGESPDSDNRRFWERSLDSTVAHFRSGKHARN